MQATTEQFRSSVVPFAQAMLHSAKRTQTQTESTREYTCEDNIKTVLKFQGLEMCTGFDWLRIEHGEGVWGF